MLQKIYKTRSMWWHNRQNYIYVQAYDAKSYNYHAYLPVPAWQMSVGCMGMVCCMPAQMWHQR